MEQKEGLEITWWSVFVNLALGSFKCLVGTLGHSMALLADGVHSLVDLSTDIAVIVGLKMAAKPSDASHPYGHHKFTTVATLFISLAIVLSSAGIVITSIERLASGRADTPAILAFWAALLSLVVKEVLFWRTRLVARRMKSQIILANAWHHRTDSLTSLIAALAVGSVYLGGPEWALLDSAAGIALGGYLAFEGFRIFHGVFNDLVDAAPTMEIINDLREHVLPIDGAIAYHDFRARRTGDTFEVDLHLQVDPDMSVKEGHAVAKRVKESILEIHPEVINVLVHIEPATEDHIRPSGVFDTTGEAGDDGA